MKFEHTWDFLHSENCKSEYIVCDHLTTLHSEYVNTARLKVDHYFVNVLL